MIKGCRGVVGRGNWRHADPESKLNFGPPNILSSIPMSYSELPISKRSLKSEQFLRKWSQLVVHA